MSYSSPNDIETALEILSTSAPPVVAGGTDFFPAAGPRAIWTPILDITRIADLSGITQVKGGFRIGATTTWSDIIASDLPPAFNALKEAAREVGSVQIQNAGTLAGNLCNASPAADGVPALLILDAMVELRSAARGTRTLPLADFITGPRQTSAAPDELLTAVFVPSFPVSAASAFGKLGARRYLVISTAMCAALAHCDTEGRLTELRLAVGACAPVALRLRDLETKSLGLRPDQIEIAPSDLSALSPIDDVRADATYRLEAIATQLRRTIARAADKARP